jgi:predicted metal-dependent peptidase
MYEGEPDKLWYVACDLAINSMLNIENLPPGGLVPGQFESIPAGHRNIHGKEFSSKHEKFAKLIRSLPRNKSANWYYDKLKQESDNREVAESLGNKDQAMDEHHWEELTDETRKIIDRKIHSILSGAVDEAQRDFDGWGNVSYHVRKNLANKVNQRFDWQPALQQICGTTRTPERSRTYKRLNRRMPNLLPGLRRKRTGRVVIAIDMSASVTDESIARVFAELERLAEQVEFTVVPFDVSVGNVFLWKKGESVERIRSMMGSTNFNAPTLWVNERRKDFDALIIVTDGMATGPIDCLIPRSWVLVPRTNLHFKTDELSIYMDD